MMFLSKTHSSIEELYSMRLYQRMRVTGVIRNTFQDMPWIEVLDFTMLGEQLDNAVLTHLHRGEEMMKKRLWQRAIAELSLAPGEGVPMAATRAAHKNLGICLLRMGEPEAAVGYLESAASMDTQVDFEVEELLAMARNSPSEAIDRTVDAGSLRDAERPMWEAFDAPQQNRSAMSSTRR
jgi:hypothetical protein